MAALTINSLVNVKQYILNMKANISETKEYVAIDIIETAQNSLHVLGKRNNPKTGKILPRF